MQQEWGKFLSLQNTEPCSYQLSSWEQGIPAEAQIAASGSGWIAKVTFKQSKNLAAAETWDAVQSTTLGWQEPTDCAPAGLCQGGAVQGVGSATFRDALLLSPLTGALWHCQFSAPAALNRLQGPCPSRQYPGTHCGAGRQWRMKILSLRL